MSMQSEEVFFFCFFFKGHKTTTCVVMLLASRVFETRTHKRKHKVRVLRSGPFFGNI